MNTEDVQRADDLERVLDEGALARAQKMVGKWSKAHAQIAVNEVQARSIAHRDATQDDAPGSSFAVRDEELTSLRAMIEA